MRYVNIPGPNGKGVYQEFWEVVDRDLPNYVPTVTGLLVISLVLLTLLVVGGIGLIKMKGWGRALSIFFAVSFALLQTASMIYTFVLVNPAMEKALPLVYAAGPNQSAGLADVSSQIGKVASIVVYIVELIYCIVLLVNMYLPKVRAAFAARLPEPM
jgi:hypothetical protein